ncbi:DNA polymerase III subunit beta, partial [Gammaproteobacteria bacterium]|nr:DNA polymerase III subunit beta [Gammaproteobacteria bacterium]
MKFTISRENLLGPLQLVGGVIERRQTSPVLANALLKLEEDKLVITGTDQEVELTVIIANIEVIAPGAVTVPARKLLDICKSLPVGSEMSGNLEGKRLAVGSGRFKSFLATLPVTDFPISRASACDVSIELAVQDLRSLLQRTSFAMAQQDVRYFFNGVLLEMLDGVIRLVATNGQRLASSFVRTRAQGNHQFIIPRKGISELVRVLDEEPGELVTLNFTANHMQVDRGSVRLITKLIDATYPEYLRAIPTGGDKVVVVDRQLLKEALSRTAILSNEVYRNVKLALGDDRLDVHANNPQQEEAEESVTVEYKGESLDIGFNVSYLIEALSAMKGETVRMTFSDSSTACLIDDTDD